MNSEIPKPQVSFTTSELGVEEACSLKDFVQEASNSRHGIKRFLTWILILVFKDWILAGYNVEIRNKFFTSRKTIVGLDR